MDLGKHASWNDQGEWSWPQPTRPVEEIPPVCPYCTLNGTTGETGCTCGYLRQLELQKAKQEGRTADYQDGSDTTAKTAASTTRIMASQLQPGQRVRIGNEWLPVIRVSRTSEGMMVVYDERGWYVLVEPWKMVSVRVAAKTAAGQVMYHEAGFENQNDWTHFFTAPQGTKLYHMSPKSEREAILKIGLTPWEEGDQAIYLSRIPQIDNEAPPGVEDDVWEVDVSGLELERDPDSFNKPNQPSQGMPRDWWYVAGSIPPDRLRLLNEGTIASTHDNTSYVKLGALSRKKLLEMAAQLPEDTSNVVHTFPDGWTIRQPQTPADIYREGELMNHCWRDTDDWHDDNFHEPLEGVNRYHSLRDPDNLPHTSFYYYAPNSYTGSDGTHEIMDTFGSHNSWPEQYLPYLYDWVGGMGGGWHGTYQVENPDFPSDEPIRIPPKTSNDKTSMKLGMGMAGDLPEGLTFEWGTHPGFVQGSPPEGYKTLYAMLNGQEVGHLMLQPVYPQEDPEYPEYEIYHIEVDEELRRRGIANAMFERANEDYPVYHSNNIISPEGEGWNHQSSNDKTSMKLGAVPEGYEIRPMGDTGYFDHEEGKWRPRYYEVKDRNTGEMVRGDRMQTSHGTGDGVVAYYGDDPVGSLTWQEEPHATMIGSAYVHPDHRQQGLFNAMYEYLPQGKPVDAYHWDNPMLRQKVRDRQRQASMKLGGMERYAEQVPIDWLAPYIEFAREPGGEHFDRPGGSWESLRDDIAQNGIREPLIFEYDPDAGTGYVSEGSTRYSVAKELGLPSLPVLVLRSRERPRRPFVPVTQPGQYLIKDALPGGDFPQYSTPSEIGIPTLGGTTARTAMDWMGDAKLSAEGYARIEYNNRRWAEALRAWQLQRGINPDRLRVARRVFADWR